MSLDCPSRERAELDVHSQQRPSPPLARMAQPTGGPPSSAAFQDSPASTTFPAEVEEATVRPDQQEPPRSASPKPPPLRRASTDFAPRKPDGSKLQMARPAGPVPSSVTQQRKGSAHTAFFPPGKDTPVNARDNLAEEDRLKPIESAGHSTSSRSQPTSLPANVNVVPPSPSHRPLPVSSNIKNWLRVGGGGGGGRLSASPSIISSAPDLDPSNITPTPRRVSPVPASPLALDRARSRPVSTGATRRPGGGGGGGAHQWGDAWEATRGWETEEERFRRTGKQRHGAAGSRPASAGGGRMSRGGTGMGMGGSGAGRESKVGGGMDEVEEEGGGEKGRGGGRERGGHGEEEEEEMKLEYALWEQLPDVDFQARPFHYHSGANLLTNIDVFDKKSEKTEAVLVEERRFMGDVLASLDLFFRPGHQTPHIFLSHRFAVASEDLDELRSLLEVTGSTTTTADFLVRVRRGEISSKGGVDLASRYWMLVALYYENMASLPHFRRGGHYGGEDGVDAAPWGVRWEEDRKEVRAWLRSQRAEALFSERSHLFTYKQTDKMLDVLEESLAEDKLDPLRRPSSTPSPSSAHLLRPGTTLLPSIRIEKDNGPSPMKDRVVEKSDETETGVGGGREGSAHGTVGSGMTSHVAETEHDSEKGGEDETEHRQFVCGIIAVIARHRMEVFSAEHRRKLFGRSIFHTRIGNLINIPFLGIPLIYLSRVEQIYGDEVGFRNASWREFIEGLVMEWTSLNLISSLLLSSAMTMTGADEVAEFPITRMTGFATSILSIGSLVHSIFLTWTHQAKGQTEIDVGHAYLDRHAHSFTRLAIMLSLPAVMLLWALVFFAIAICAWSFEEKTRGHDPGGWLVSSTTTSTMAVVAFTIVSSIGFFRSVFETSSLKSHGGRQIKRAQRGNSQLGQDAPRLFELSDLSRMVGIDFAARTRKRGGRGAGQAGRGRGEKGEEDEDDGEWSV